jgi:hypothetical protein
MEIWSPMRAAFLETRLEVKREEAREFLRRQPAPRVRSSPALERAYARWYPCGGFVRLGSRGG